MEVVPWQARTRAYSFCAEAQGGQQTLLLAIRHPKHYTIQARAKRASSNKQYKEKSVLAPSKKREEDKCQDFSSSNNSAQDAFSLLSTTETDITRPEISCSDPTDGLASPKRGVVLKACVTTCAAIFAAGFLLQEATHLAAQSGWPVPDSTLLLNFDVDFWQLEVMLGLILSISVSRQLLLKVWPEFLESSNLANNEVLGSLTLSDYFVVTMLPGVSEEMLFRGALLPLVGLDWRGAAITGLLFGVLHLSGGRKTSFAIWASVVGLLYGLACVVTHSVVVPMAAHSANNLVGAFVWRLQQQRSFSDGN